LYIVVHATLLYQFINLKLFQFFDCYYLELDLIANKERRFSGK